MNQPTEIFDPCKLRSLPEIPLEEDLWPAIQAQIKPVAPASSRRPQWLALAASALLAVLLITQLNLQQPTELQAEALVETPVEKPTSEIDQQGQLQRLITLSQSLEKRIYSPRLQNGPVSAYEAVVIAELEDMIAVIDQQLLQQTTDPELWYRRVTLLADLAGVYQQRQKRNLNEYVAL